MASALGWLDHDANAQAKTLNILALFQQKESRDELGIGTIRDSFAEQLFPGTSTIQTRLRYMLFVPWIYQRLENKRISAVNFGTQADSDERALIIPLTQLEEDSAGTFGKNSREKLKRLPSSVYWSGLRRWGIRETSCSQEEYHRRVDELYCARTENSEREYQEKNQGNMGDASANKPAQSWHSSLPAPPPNFPDEATFALTRAVEWLTDNGSCYIADATKTFAASLGFIECTTPVRSPESNGMAESFVKTFKRDYVYVNALPDAMTVMGKLTEWMEDYNNWHPHKWLKMQSPREYRSSLLAIN